MVSERMKEWRASGSADVGRVGLTLTHSRFLQTWHLTNHYEGFDAKVSNGATVSFIKHPFEVIKPAVGEDARSDMRLSIFNSGVNFVKEILRAQALVREPIKCEVNDYWPGDLDSQIEPITLSLTSLVVDDEKVTGTATSVDFLNLRFPRNIYDFKRWPGLNRE